MSNAQHTPGPLVVGCQNDALFLVAGRAPSPNNDYPWHDAPRVAVAKLLGQTDGDCLPVDADKNGALLAAAYTSYDKHFGPNAIAAAEADLLGEALDALRHLVRSVDDLISESEGVYGLHLNGDPAPWCSLTEGGHFEDWLIELERARALLAKAGRVA